MSEETHTPKKIMVDGKEKVVYVRTSQTEMELDRYRMGFFSGVSPLPLASFGEKLREKQLIILASHDTAQSVIRSRLELDKRPHRFLTGTTLLQYYFDNGSSIYLEGFPVFKQFYLMFGYSESRNKIMHEAIVATLFSRHYAENHFWLIIPKTLEAMAAQWGDAFMNLQMFPVLNLLGVQEETGPISVANPVVLDSVKDTSYRENFNEFGEPLRINDDPEESRRRKRDDEKLKRKSF